MKILLITQHYGKTAPGKVFETLIREIIKSENIKVWALNFNPSDNIPLPILKIKEPNLINKRITYHINQIFYRLFNISWVDWRIKKKIPKIIEEYDVVFALCSSHNTTPLIIAQELKKKYALPIAAYFVDAIPTPSWWDPSKINSNIAHFIKKYTAGLCYFASSNSIMLEYQKKYLNNSCKKKAVIYTPGYRLPYIEDNRNPLNPIFIFTGSCYGLRKPDYVFSAFSRLIKIYPQAILKFIGTSPTILSKVPKDIKNNVEVLKYTYNLIPFYEQATALIDIDACVDNDIFLSSKITNYLYIPRPIICQTGNNSPARQLFSGLSSVILCNHNEDEIYHAMIKSIEEKFNFLDRELVLKIFDAKQITHKILYDLDSAIKL